MRRQFHDISATTFDLTEWAHILQVRKVHIFFNVSAILFGGETRKYKRNNLMRPGLF